jgi:hypothetical protein
MDPRVADDVVRRIWAEYTEMPGLSITIHQGQRLWGLDRLTCAGALDLLITAGLLRKTVSGQYTRSRDGRTASPSLRMARVESRTIALTTIRDKAADR